MAARKRMRMEFLLIDIARQVIFYNFNVNLCSHKLLLYQYCLRDPVGQMKTA